MLCLLLWLQRLRQQRVRSGLQPVSLGRTRVLVRGVGSGLEMVLRLLRHTVRTILVCHMLRGHRQLFRFAACAAVLLIELGSSVGASQEVCEATVPK